MKSLIAALSVLLFTTLVSAQSERSLIREGNREYKANKFADAEVNYRKALEKNKEFHQGPFNLGDALYKQGRYGEAAQQYGIAASRIKDPGEKAEALHNLGNSLFKSQKYPESIQAYEGALKLSPNDLATKYNLEYAKQMLKQQQQQQQQQKKNDKNDKDKQKQENKDQKQQNKQDQQNKDQEKQDQQKQDQKKQDQQQAQQKKQQISKQDAERILEALRNEEKEVQKKLHQKVQARVRVEKDW
jgi:Ca-activated chloride channel family protein